MSALFLLGGLMAAGEALAASTLVPLTAELLIRAYPRNAAARRLIWLGAFMVLLALPVLAMVAPSLMVVIVPAGPPEALAPTSAATLGSSSFAVPALLALGLVVWLAGVAWLGLRQLTGLFHRHRLRRAAAPWPDPLPLAVRGCTVLISDQGLGPMTWGVLRPVILLPVEALDWTAERLEAVLRHELAHVRRRDCLAQALAFAVCAAYWPNPVVWRAARALQHEAEQAADDAVLAGGVRPSDYAGHLLDLAKGWREHAPALPGLAMAAPPALSRRVQSILSTEAIRTGATAMDAFKLALLGTVATAALVLARPSIAEVDAVKTAQPIRSAPAIEERPLAEAAPAVDPRPVSSLQPAVRSAVRVAVRAATATEGAEVQPDDGWPLSREQQAELDRTLDRELERQLKDLGPTIEKAIAEAHIEETVAKALAEVQPQIDAAVARAQARAQEAAQRAREKRRSQDL